MRKFRTIFFLILYLLINASAYSAIESGGSGGSLDDYVPYVGAINDVDLGSYYLSSTDSLRAYGTGGASSNYVFLTYDSDNNLGYLWINGGGNLVLGAINGRVYLGTGMTGIMPQTDIGSSLGYVDKRFASLHLGGNFAEPYGIKPLIYFYKSDEANKYILLDTETPSGMQTITLPDATGTIALISDLVSYIPYTGASSNVDLGLYNLEGYKITAKQLWLEDSTGSPTYGKLITDPNDHFEIRAYNGIIFYTGDGGSIKQMAYFTSNGYMNLNCGDYDDYIVVKVVANIPEITTYGSCDLKINSELNLKLMSTAVGSVTCFEDTQVGDVSDGKKFTVHRKASEGDSYLDIYGFNDTNFRIKSSSGLMIAASLGGIFLDLGDDIGSQQIAVRDSGYNIQWSVNSDGVMDWSQEPAKPKIYDQNDEPDIPNNTGAFWKDADGGPKFYLILDVDSIQYKTELI